jgi:hypothetical protein
MEALTAETLSGAGLIRAVAFFHVLVEVLAIHGSSPSKKGLVSFVCQGLHCSLKPVRLASPRIIEEPQPETRMHDSRRGSDF